eukprot:TRINITY_DN4875_c0_g1_i1.p1 TRINITY_DN4875_c0_g1~~TRINITY_DN4875_c0_g1_i1.p1  ORF type:complete len:242 (+),score=102.67 TRINITY_DN4875_c0_g1_i1:106-831(+)
MSKKVKTEQETAKEDEIFEKYFKEIEQVNDELAKVNEEIAKKQQAIFREYEPKKKPFYKKRSEIVANIPHFWADSLSRHRILENVIEDNDKEVLNYITDIDYEVLQDVEEGNKISFHFKSNPYFTNASLWKAYIFKDGTWEITTSGINWKEGKDLTAPREVVKKGKKRGHAESNSFFKWFTSAEGEEGPEQDYIEHSIREVFETPEKYYWGLVSDDEFSDDDDEVEFGEEGDDDDDEENDD